MIIDRSVIINSVDDALDVIASTYGTEDSVILILKEQFHPDFFDLKTGLAGEILQKFVQYNVRVGIIGNFDNIESKSLRDFIFESNKSGRIAFASDLDMALSLLKES